MSEQRAFFSGTYTQRLDPKGRLILPSPLRKRAEKEDPTKDFYLTLAEPGCLNCYTSVGWQRQIDRMLAELEAHEGQEDYERLVTAFDLFNESAHTVTLGDQGRLVIPAPLKEASELPADVVIAGAVTMVQIWDPAKHAERRALGREHYAEAIGTLTRRRR